MRIPNNTHYHTIYSMFYNTFPDPDSFSSESSRRDSFYQRLYYEHEYTKLKGGITFFYTLTYNDKSIPKFEGRNTFSYKDIRYVTNGRLSKTLLRHYGAKMRYFCSCERGEGKGVRGIGNNPHYHFIFFITPFNNKFSLTPQVFDNLLKELWQGKSGYIKFQRAKFGIVKAGKFGNVVTGTEAFKYVSKYVTKDSSSKSDYDYFSKLFHDRIVNDGLTTSVFIYYCRYLRIIEPSLSLSEILDFYDISLFNKWKRLHRSMTTSEALNVWLRDYCLQYYEPTNSHIPFKYMDLRKWFDEVYVPAAHKELLSYFVTEFSDKPRFSKSLGSYGLNFIKDVDTDPHLIIPSSSGIYSVKPCLYYQRKLYYNTVKCPITGNILYRLNDLGFKYRLNSIERRIESSISNTIANIDYVVRNDVYVYHFSSDFDNLDLDNFSGFKLPIDNSQYQPDYKYRHYLKELCDNPSFERIVRLYSIYNNVYRYRSFDNYDFIALSTDLDIEDVKRDYKFFLSHSYLELDSFDVSLCLCQRRDSISFSSFYLFLPYLDYFDFLDSINDAVNNILSAQRKQTYYENSALAKLHTANTITE